MNRISKGDLILVPRKYAESVIPDYNGSFTKNMGVRTMACAAGIDKGAEDNTLLYIRELTDHFTTIAIPILEVSESDSLLSLCSKAVRNDEFEKSGYIKITDDVPIDELRELHYGISFGLMIKEMQLRPLFACALAASGIAAAAVIEFVLKPDIVNAVLYFAIAVLFAYLILSVSQRLMSGSYIDHRHDMMVIPFYKLQKKYNFFYYEEDTYDRFCRYAFER